MVINHHESANENFLPDRRRRQAITAIHFHETQGFLENCGKICIAIYQMKNEVIDIGRPGSFIAGNHYFLEKAKFSMEFQVLQNPHIVQPTYIGKNVVIKNFIIGPFVSVGDNVEIVNSIIQNSMIGDCSSLTRVIIADSIIGDECRLEEIIMNHITIGDHSVIASGKNSFL